MRKLHSVLPETDPAVSRSSPEILDPFNTLRKKLNHPSSVRSNANRVHLLKRPQKSGATVATSEYFHIYTNSEDSKMHISQTRPPPHWGGCWYLIGVDWKEGNPGPVVDPEKGLPFHHDTTLLLEEGWKEDLTFSYPGLGENLDSAKTIYCPIGWHPEIDFGHSNMLPVREVTMMQLMDSLTDKPGWERKVFDDEIVEKWHKEILASEELGAWSDRAFTSKVTTRRILPRITEIVEEVHDFTKVEPRHLLSRYPFDYVSSSFVLDGLPTNRFAVHKRTSRKGQIL